MLIFLMVLLFFRLRTDDDLSLSETFFFTVKIRFAEFRLKNTFFVVLVFFNKTKALWNGISVEDQYFVEKRSTVRTEPNHIW